MPPKKAARKTTRKTTRRRGPAAPRGPEAREAALALDGADVASARQNIELAGGVALAAFRDPYAGSALVLASLPLRAIEPTEFQRDLSRTHAERLATAIGAAGAFLDPVIAVWTRDGFRSPNGRHRLAAAKQLGQRAITALVVADDAIVYRILPLNTEKAHNLRDRSLEVIRMARSIAKARPRTKESEEAVAFESPFLLTLGVAYEARGGRFSGSVYQPMLRRVEVFLDATLPKALRQREQWANRLLKIDAAVAEHINALQERGFKSPYLKTLVVARCNPVRWIPQKRGAPPPMTASEAIARMDAAVKKFKPNKVQMGDLALVAAVASDEE